MMGKAIPSGVKAFIVRVKPSAITLRSPQALESKSYKSLNPIALPSLTVIVALPSDKL